MNRLQLKALLLSVITELKFGQPLSPNAGVVKKQYKELVGLKPNASNKSVLACLQFTYTDCELKEEFDKVIQTHKAEKFLPETPIQ